MIPKKKLSVAQSTALHQYQTTVASAISFKGVGVHSGIDIRMNLFPAPEDFGIVFERVDLNHPHNKINASFDFVSNTAMSTTLTNRKGISISTVEHLMAAFSGLGITNCLVQIDGPELPIMDGSSKPFCDEILKHGTSVQLKKKQSIRILKKVRIESGKNYVEFLPNDTSLFEMKFDFYGRMPEKLIKNSAIKFDLDHDSFYDLVSHARTFGFYEDATLLQERGLAKGASLDNTIVIKDGGILNTEGLRHVDEFIQHKILDAIGDIALSPFKIKGLYKSYNGSHALNNALLRKLFLTPDAIGFDEF